VLAGNVVHAARMLKFGVGQSTVDKYLKEAATLTKDFTE
jgi:hypothetical protein